MSAQRLLSLYPRHWRERYGAEMADLLEAREPGWADALDLVRGALDAHLHPPGPSSVPALAAVTAGAAWMVVGLAVIAEPVTPDWPGFLASDLPVAVVGVAAGLLAVLGLVLGVGPGRRPALRAATALGIFGLAALLGALGLAALDGPYGTITGAALALGGASCIAVGGVLITRGATIAGDLLVIAGATWLLPAPWAWLAAGVAWLALGLAMVVDGAHRRAMDAAHSV